MKKCLSKLISVLGGVTLVVILAAVVVGIFFWLSGESVPDKTVLEVDFEKGLIEYVPDDSVAEIMLGKYARVRDVTDALEKAADDDKVVGLIARIGATSQMGGAQIQEVRDAVLAFRKKGKSTVAFSETFGEVGPGNGSYYLASAFEKIYLQPSGDIGLTGMMAETPFIRGTLDELKLVPRMDHRHEYKNAKNIFTEKEYTAPHREAMKKLIESFFGQIVRGIAQGRGLPENEVRALVDRGPFIGQEALDAKLVDGLAYWDEVHAKIKEKEGEDAELLYLSKYLDRAGRPHTDGQTIALIYGVGGVVRGPSGYDPLFGDAAMGSETVAAAFRSAIDDDDVKAILFRVDSPGGSYVASDTIWRETVRAKEAGKPVIVSMGNLAASGGYFVSMHADKIVAQPGTITGSIGVLGGKMLTTGFWDKLGISWDDVQSGANAAMWTGTHDYSPEGWSRFQAWLDRVYDDFTTKVAKGRGLPIERVLQIAKGRIWSGEDALALGLVDELGGLPAALRLCKEAAGIPAEEDVCLKLFPEKKSFLDILLEDGPDSSEGKAVAATLSHALKMVQSVARLAGDMGLVRGAGVLTMPATGLEKRKTK